MKRYFLYEMIYARIAGTGMDSARIEILIKNSNDSKIIGLKSFIKQFSTFFYQKIIQKMSNNANEITLDILYQILSELLPLFDIECQYFDLEFQQIVGDGSVWDRLDIDQQCAFLIHAFLSAFERTREELAKNAVHILNNLASKHSFEIENYNRNYFGFAFRTREYVLFANEKFFNRGYSKLLQKCNKTLFVAYQKEFLKQPEDSTQIKSNSEPNKNNKITQQLSSFNPVEILEAINWIEKNNDKSYTENLEYLLNHSNPEVMEKAFEVVMKFKGEL